MGAWRLELGGGHAGLIGERQMLHLLPAPLSLHEVPASPFFCRHVVVWEQEPIPVMDLSAWLEGRPVREGPGVVAIAAFASDTSGENRRGALMLSAIPRRIVVTDGLACDLPPDLVGWREIALSCIEHEARPIPVMNLTYVFSGVLSQLPAVPELAEDLVMATDACVDTVGR